MHHKSDCAFTDADWHTTTYYYCTATESRCARGSYLDFMFIPPVCFSPRLFCVDLVNYNLLVFGVVLDSLLLCLHRTINRL